MHTVEKRKNIIKQSKYIFITLQQQNSYHLILKYHKKTLQTYYMKKQNVA